jgi:hypothetical protein
VRKANDAEMTVSGAAVKSAAAGKYDSSTGVVLEEQCFFSPVQSAAGNRKAQRGLIPIPNKNVNNMVFPTRRPSWPDLQAALSKSTRHS